MDGADAKTLRDAVDRFKDKLQSAVVVVGSVDDGKVRLAAGVTKNNTDRIRAGDLIKPSPSRSAARAAVGPTLPRRAASNPEALDRRAGLGAGVGRPNIWPDRLSSVRLQRSKFARVWASETKIG